MKNKKKTYSHSLPIDLMTRLERIAGKSYRTKSGSIEEALTEYVERKEKQEKQK